MRGRYGIFGSKKRKAKREAAAAASDAALYTAAGQAQSTMLEIMMGASGAGAVADPVRQAWAQDIARDPDPRWEQFAVGFSQKPAELKKKFNVGQWIQGLLAPKPTTPGDLPPAGSPPGTPPVGQSTTPYAVEKASSAFGWIAGIGLALTLGLGTLVVLSSRGGRRRRRR